MANNNETVAEIADTVRHLADNLNNGIFLTKGQCNYIAHRIEAAYKREIAEKDAEIKELRELLIELANAANTAFDDIAKCGSIIADGDVRDAVYRTHLMERIAKYREALKGGAK